MLRRAVGLWSCLAVVLALASPARANGRFPAAQQVVLGPGSSSEIIALRTTFGMIVSRDAGRTFQYVCEDLMFCPVVPGATSDPAVEVTSRGDVVVGFEAGVNVMSDACRSTRGDVVRDHYVYDLTATPAGDVLYGIANDPGVANHVYRATADTLRWTPQGDGVAGVDWLTLEVAGSSTNRLYLSGIQQSSGEGRIFRSDDGGVTLRALMTDVTFDREVYVSGVDPTNPDVVYLRVNVGFGSQLLRSENGGASFQRVASTTDAMLGFAISDDGRTVWIGSIENGLLRADDGGRTFVPVSDVPVLSLRQHGGALWLVTDWIGQPFALGRSTDGGAHFTGVLRFRDLTGPATCPGADDCHTTCVDRWPALRDLIADRVSPPDAGAVDVVVRDAARDVNGVDRPDAPRDATANDGGRVDASTARDAGAGGGGGRCDCAVGRTERPGRAWVLGLAPWVLRRRRRRLRGV